MDAGAHENCRDEFGLDRFAVDLLGDEWNENGRALAMADEHDAAAFVTVDQVFVPSVDNVFIAESGIVGHIGAG